MHLAFRYLIKRKIRKIVCDEKVGLKPKLSHYILDPVGKEEEGKKDKKQQLIANKDVGCFH